VTRRTAATLILLAWVGALGWLVQRHYLAGTGGGEGAHWPVPPGSTFLSVRLGERQYGLSSLAIDTLPDGYRVTELVTVDLPQPRPNSVRRTSSRIEAHYTRRLQLVQWQGELLTERGRSTSHGVVNGDTLLSVVTDPVGEKPETLTVHLRRPIVLPSAMPLIAAARGLPRTGDKLNIEVYDPLDQELRIERLSVAAESVFTVPDSADYNDVLRRWRVAHADTVRAWRYEAIEHGLPVSRWVDAAGMTLRTRHALGARLDRSVFEVVNNNFRALPPPRWDTSAAAPRFELVDGPPAPRRSLSVVARLDPDEPLPSGLPGLNGGWQERTGDSITVAPRSGTDTTAEVPGTVEALIGEDSTITGTAELVTGQERRPEVVARKLTDWVHRTITLRQGSGTGSAARALADRAGTPEERVRLLVALARAAGLEARTVWGLVLVDSHWQLRPWAEVRTGVWTPADPAAATPASAARIRLSTGGQPRLLDLALRAGRLRLEVREDTR
jgi:transglutaminase-like putative cysteine protease